GAVISDPQAETAELDLFSVNTPNVIYMAERQGMLHFTINDGNGPTDVATILYDPVAHHYWRVSHAGGVTRWETSTDDKAGTTRASQRMDWVTYVSVNLAASSSAAPYTV